ncbi:MAG: ornithine cyclodeaminase family protein [Geminicoccaceae bacterium]|nr:ornithine cyclodeaminase family protein [Geminicoccaceae bacterium]
MPTIILVASDVRRLLDRPALLAALRDAFAAYSTRRTIPAQRAGSPLPGEGGRTVMVVYPGLIDGIPAFTVKVNTKVPGAVRSVIGSIHLADLETGEVLAIMDSVVITAERTALAGGLAADVLARPDVSRVAVIGAGVQGEAQVRALQLVRRVERVDVVDAMPERAEGYAARVGRALGIEVVVRDRVTDAVRDADVIITATWSKRPFLTRAMVRDGVHITAVGADEPAKGEVDAELIRSSLFACDDRHLAAGMGAIAGAGLGPDAIHAELGEIIAGVKPGRTSAEQITIFGTVGLAFQDLAAAWQVYGAARATGTGVVVEL